MMNAEEKHKKIKNFATRQLNKIILPFWEMKIVDDRHGGFIGKIDMEDRRYYDSPKGIILNARLLWTFSAVYGKTGNMKYLDLARRAFDYIDKNFQDPMYEGYYWMLNPDGSLNNGKKQVYAQAFVIYALAEYALQTGDRRRGERGLEIFSLIEEKAFDSEKNGYFEAFSRKWEDIEDLRLSDLDMNEKKTMNTHLHILEAYTHLYRFIPDAVLKSKIQNLLHVFDRYILNKKKNHLNLFFDENWQIKSTAISYGHDIESAWLLREAAIVLKDEKEIDRFSAICIKLAESALSAVGDEGGLIHDRDFHNVLPEEYEWWAQAEGIVGFSEAWKISGDDRYLDAALGLAQFIDNYFVDKKFGEWYYRLDKNRNPIPGYEKAGFWKCPYHSVRMCLEIMR